MCDRVVSTARCCSASWSHRCNKIVGLRQGAIWHHMVPQAGTGYRLAQGTTGHNATFTCWQPSEPLLVMDSSQKGHRGSTKLECTRACKLQVVSMWCSLDTTPAREEDLHSKELSHFVSKWFRFQSEYRIEITESFQCRVESTCTGCLRQLHLRPQVICFDAVARCTVSMVGHHTGTAFA